MRWVRKMNKKKASDVKYWNKQGKEKKPVLLITIVSILCLILAYMISGLGH